MKTILITNFVSVHHALNQNVIELKWNGVIPLKDVKIAIDAIKRHLGNDYCLIFNCSELEAFDSDARIWLRSAFLREELKQMSFSLSAIVNIESEFDIKSFLKPFNQLISVLYPELDVRSYTNVNEANDWINQRYLKKLLKKGPAISSKNDIATEAISPVFGKLLTTWFN